MAHSTRSLALHAKRAKRRGRKRRWNQGTGTCLNRHATLVSLHPSIIHLSFPAPWNTAAVFTSDPFPRLAPDSLCLVLTLFPLLPLLLCIVSQWWTTPSPPLRRLPPSPPDPSSWGGLKCHSFSSCARFHAPKESVFPFPSFSLSIFSLLLSSHTPSLPRSALAFVDRVILAPGRRQNRGEMGRAIFGFLLCWKW